MQSVENRLSVLGGATVAASGLFWSVPALNTVAALAGIVALIMIMARLGFARSVSAALAGIILAYGSCSLTNGYLGGLYYVVVYAMVVIAPALIMGWASRGLASPVTVICYGLIPLGILLLLFADLYINWMRNLAAVTNMLYSAMETYVKSNPVLMKMIQQNYGAGETGMAAFSKEFGDFLERMLKITPGFLVTVFLGMAVFSLALAGYLATRMGIIISRFRPFYLWKASGWWLLPTILGLIPVVFRMNELWFYTGLNLLILTGHVYMVVGLAILEAFFKRIYVVLPVKIVFYILLVLAGPISMAFLAILGLSDTKFGFKREVEEFEDKDE